MRMWLRGFIKMLLCIPFIPLFFFIYLFIDIPIAHSRPKGQVAKRRDFSDQLYDFFFDTEK